MLVETRPTGGTVLLNGKAQKSATPTRIQKLAPGPYSVRIEKPGYHAWEKSVEVISRETTFLNDVTLFRESAPTLFADLGTTENEEFSRDARYAAAVVATPSGAELVIVDLRNGAEYRPYRVSAGSDDLRLSWSRDSRRLLVTREGRSPSRVLWDSSDPERMRDLSAESALDLSAAFWSQDTDRLYAVAGGELYELDLDLATPVPAGPAPAAPVVAEGTVYGIVPGTPDTLVRRRLRDKAFEVVAELPSADFVPLRGQDAKIAYVSNGSERLFVIDPSSGPKAFEGRGRGGTWSADGQRLLYWNDLEVRVYDARNGSDELITRLSGPIRQAAWHRPEWNVLYASGDDLFAVETDDRHGRVTVPLSGYDALDVFASSRNGDYLYAFGTIGGSSGLWRTRIR